MSPSEGSVGSGLSSGSADEVDDEVSEESVDEVSPDSLEGSLEVEVSSGLLAGSLGADGSDTVAELAVAGFSGC